MFPITFFKDCFQLLESNKGSLSCELSVVKRYTIFTKKIKMKD